MEYVGRTIDGSIDRLLRVAGAIVLEGARAVGKTATGEHHSRSSVRLDVDDQARALVSVNPQLLLEGMVPRLLDEWQFEPALWNHVRHAVDERREPGQFILTGSAAAADDITRHSGAGRILRLRMRPMTLAESGHSTREVSLASLFEQGTEVVGHSALDLGELAERLCIGGWPGMQHFVPSDAQQLLRSYLDDVARVDIEAAGAGGRRDAARVRRMIAAYARHVATSASAATLAADATGDRLGPLHVDTVRGYIAALERIWIVEEQPSWGPHLRSRDVVRKAAVRHLVDPSLAAAALGAGPQRLLREPRTMGLMFESMVVRDLRVYAQAIDGEVFHYRDSAGSEADAVVQLTDGRWIAIEAKLGVGQIDAAATSLEKFRSKVDTSVTGEPAARVVITGGGYAFTRPDGVHVVPLACLAP